MHNKISINRACYSWLLLIVLTIAAVYMGHFIVERSLYIIVALAIVVIKGQQVVDVFMDLNKAPRFWRLLFLSYITLLPVILTIIYLV